MARCGIRLNANLNPERCFNEVSSAAETAWERYNPPHDWINQLAKRIQSLCPEQRLDDLVTRIRNVTDAKKNAAAEKVREALKNIYGLWSGITDPNISLDLSQQDTGLSLALKLVEGTTSCPEGFSNRVLDLWNSLKCLNLEQLLQNYRRDLTRRAARELFSNETPNVHADAFVSLVAADEKLGVSAINPNDIHMQAYAPNKKRAVALLRSQFELYYTPLLIIENLESQLLSHLQHLGYDGIQEYNAENGNGGYSQGPIEIFINYLQKTFSDLTTEKGGSHPINRESCVSCVFDEDAVLLAMIDLNWRQIRQFLFAQLKLQGHFINVDTLAALPIKTEGLTTSADFKEFSYWVNCIANKENIDQRIQAEQDSFPFYLYCAATERSPYWESLNQWIGRQTSDDLRRHLDVNLHWHILHWKPAQWKLMLANKLSENTDCYTVFFSILDYLLKNQPENLITVLESLQLTDDSQKKIIQILFSNEMWDQILRTGASNIFKLIQYLGKNNQSISEAQSTQIVTFFDLTNNTILAEQVEKNPKEAIARMRLIFALRPQQADEQRLLKLCLQAGNKDRQGDSGSPLQLVLKQMEQCTSTEQLTLYTSPNFAAQDGSLTQFAARHNPAALVCLFDKIKQLKADPEIVAKAVYDALIILFQNNPDKIGQYLDFLKHFDSVFFQLFFEKYGNTLWPMVLDSSAESAFKIMRYASTEVDKLPLEQIKSLLYKKTDSEKETPFMLAIKNGDSDTVTKILMWVNRLPMAEKFHIFQATNQKGRNSLSFALESEEILDLFLKSVRLLPIEFQLVMLRVTLSTSNALRGRILPYLGELAAKTPGNIPRILQRMPLIWEVTQLNSSELDAEDLKSLLRLRNKYPKRNKSPFGKTKNYHYFDEEMRFLGRTFSTATGLEIIEERLLPLKMINRYKEEVLCYIMSRPLPERQQLLQTAITKGTTLNSFFGSRRTLFTPHDNAGTFWAIRKLLTFTDDEIMTAWYNKWVGHTKLVEKIFFFACTFLIISPITLGLIFAPALNLPIWPLLVTAVAIIFIIALACAIRGLVNRLSGNTTMELTPNAGPNSAQENAQQQLVETSLNYDKDDEDNGQEISPLLSNNTDSRRQTGFHRAKGLFNFFGPGKIRKADRHSHQNQSPVTQPGSESSQNEGAAPILTTCF